MGKGPVGLFTPEARLDIDWRRGTDLEVGSIQALTHGTQRYGHAIGRTLAPR